MSETVTEECPVCHGRAIGSDRVFSCECGARYARSIADGKPVSVDTSTPACDACLLRRVVHLVPTGDGWNLRLCDECKAARRPETP